MKIETAVKNLECKQEYFELPYKEDLVLCTIFQSFEICNINMGKLGQEGIVNALQKLQNKALLTVFGHEPSQADLHNLRILRVKEIIK